MLAPRAHRVGAGYPTGVSDIGILKHAAILAALVINLWFGGDLVEAWAGHTARTFFELALILGWMTLVLGMRAPLPRPPWRRRKDDEAS